jgi:hypothetical protein
VTSARNAHNGCPDAAGAAPRASGSSGGGAAPLSIIPSNCQPGFAFFSSRAAHRLCSCDPT